jgi:hypothetical protein
LSALPRQSTPPLVVHLPQFCFCTPLPPLPRRGAQLLPLTFCLRGAEADLPARLSTTVALPCAQIPSSCMQMLETADPMATRADSRRPGALQLELMADAHQQRSTRSTTEPAASPTNLHEVIEGGQQGTGQRERTCMCGCVRKPETYKIGAEDRGKISSRTCLMSGSERLRGRN